MCVPNGTASFSMSNHCSSLSVLNRSNTGCWKVLIRFMRTSSSMEERAVELPTHSAQQVLNPGRAWSHGLTLLSVFLTTVATSSFPSPGVTFLSLCKVSDPTVSTEAELLHGPLSPHLFLATQTICPRWWSHHFIVITSYSRNRREV